MESKYIWLLPFYNGITGIWKKTGKKIRFGYIDTSGTEVIECKYFAGDTYFSLSGYASVMDIERNVGIIDRSGNYIFKHPHSKEAFQESDAECELDLIKTFAQSHLIAYLSDNPFGDVWKVVNPEYDNEEIGFFADISGQSNSGLISVADFHSEKWGVINENGEWTVPALYDSIDISPYSINMPPPDYFGAVITGGHGLLSRLGEVILDFVYDDIQYG